MNTFINYALTRELRQARKNQVIYCIGGLVEMGMPHKEALGLAYNMGSDLDWQFTEQVKACFERQSTRNFGDNGYNLPGFYWDRVL